MKVVIRVKNNTCKYYQIMKRTHEGISHVLSGRLFWSMQEVEETCNANGWEIDAVGDDWEILG